MDVPICVENPCAILGLTGTEFNECTFEKWCAFRKEQPMTLNNIYSAAYILTKNVPVVLGGTSEIIQNDVGEWFFRSIAIQTIPYTAVFIMLFIALMASNVISVWVGLWLIIALIILVVVCIYWIKDDLTGTATSVSDQLRTQIDNNWSINGATIGRQLDTALSVKVDTLACTGCGFEPSAAFPGCTAAVSPFCTGCINPSYFCGSPNNAAETVTLSQPIEGQTVIQSDQKQLVTIAPPKQGDIIATAGQKRCCGGAK